jgi:hypothetical protein
MAELPGSSSAADTQIGAAQLTYPPGAGQRVSDPGASGGTALRLDGDGAAWATVAVPQDLTRVVAEVRADQCLGAPSMTMSLDGQAIYTGSVGNASYWEVGSDVGGTAGPHTLSIALTNPYGSPLLGCQRRLWVGSVTINGQPFVPESFVNKPLATDARLDPNSPGLVADLVRQVDRYGTWVNTSDYGVPVYTVSANYPTRRVESATPTAGLDPQWAAVPLPSDAQPASGSDHQLCVYQPSTDTLWEFEGLQRDIWGRWTAWSGGRMMHVSTNPGYFIDPPGPQFGATATGISVLAGLQRIGELKAGAIHHVVAFALPQPRDEFRWPAQRMDPGLTNRAPNSIPEGTIFRLPANLHIDALPLSPYGRILAHAVQSYGMVVRDRGGAVGFAAESPRFGGDPYSEPGGVFRGQRPDGHGALAHFPWDKLEVVAPPAVGRASARSPGWRTGSSGRRAGHAGRRHPHRASRGSASAASDDRRALRAGETGARARLARAARW